MKTPLYLAILAMLVLALSYCKKEDLRLESGLYHPSYIEPRNKPRLFTRNGEIKDQKIVTRYYLPDTALFKERLQNFTNSRDDSIRIIDESHLKFHSSQYNYTIRNSLLTGRVPDTVTYYSSNEIISRKLDYHLCLYKPVILNENVYDVFHGNYLFSFQTVPDLYLLIQKGQYKRPVIIANDHHTPNNYDNLVIVTNILDEEFYTKLSATDTISLQESLVVYEK